MKIYKITKMIKENSVDSVSSAPLLAILMLPAVLDAGVPTVNVGSADKTPPKVECRPTLKHL